MVKFSLYDEHDQLIRKIDVSGDLPNGVSSILICGPFDFSKTNYKVLTRLLKSHPTRLESIRMEGLAADSPEFLSFLALICNKTKELHVLYCQLSSHAMTCAMGAMLAHDGIRSCKFWLHTIDKKQAEILLEGVASSPCLETFEFYVNTLSEELVVGKCLIKALRRNRSLKEITLQTDSFAATNDTLFPDILKASILVPNVKAVNIFDNGVNLPLDVLQDALCHNVCTLERLYLYGISNSAAGAWDGSIIQNSSVRSLQICEGHSGFRNCAKVVNLFKSLEELVLSNCNISKLSFLDDLLLGETSHLKSLDVRNNPINQAEMEKFIEKLQNIRGLKYFAVSRDDEWEDSLDAKLVDALKDNTDLEYVDLDCDDLDLTSLDFNRGGRRVLESGQPFPRNLLPHVLERASKILYYNQDDSWGEPSNEEKRADVVFWMIRRIAPDL